MLELLETLLVGATAGTLVATVASFARTSGLGRMAIGAVGGAWLGLAAAVTAGGYLKSPATLPLMFAAPLVAGGVLAAISARFRAALAAIPSTYIIGSNVFRAVGFFFLILLVQGQLGGPFPYFAGIGDIITGLFALPAARLAQRAPLSDPRILAWNAFGMLDLVVAVTLGVLSSPNFPFALIHAGAGSAGIGTLPWSMIPLVLVPTYLIGHAVIFARALGQPQENAVTT